MAISTTNSLTNSTAYVGVLDTMADWEVGYLMVELKTGRFTGTPWSVRTIAESTEPITTMGGLRVLPDLAVDDVDPTSAGLLILPGAGAPAWNSSTGSALVALARRFLDAGVPVAAICGATEALARDGLLDDRRHTGGAREALSYQPGYHGAENYVDERAVADQGLITAGPQSPAQFARATLSCLGLASEETLEAWEGVFHRADPSAYGRLMQATGA